MNGHACSDGINGRCFRKYPAFARRAMAYRVLWRVVPSNVIGFLRRGLERPLVGRGVGLPGGVDFPGGFVIFPDVEFPSGWGLGDPLPPGVFGPPDVSLVLPGDPGSEPLFVGLFSAGPAHRFAGGPVAQYESYLDGDKWEEVVVPGYELGSIRWQTDHWKVYYCHSGNDGTWGTLNVLTGSSWATGFRPTKARVSFSGESGTVKIRFYDGSGNKVGEDLNAVSPAVLGLDFSEGEDINNFRICDGIDGSHSARSFYVTDIEFLV